MSWKLQVYSLVGIVLIGFICHPGHDLLGRIDVYYSSFTQPTSPQRIFGLFGAGLIDKFRHILNF